MERLARAMRRALREAQLYGYLVRHASGLYHPGGSRPLCSVQMARVMVQEGWFVVQDERYVVTAVGLRVQLD